MKNDRKKRQVFAALLVCALWLGSPSVRAQEAAEGDHDDGGEAAEGSGAVPAPHGGMVVAADEHLSELVVHDNTVLVYVYEPSWEPRILEDAAGTMTLVAGADVSTISLTVVDDHFEGMGAAPIPPTFVAVLQMTIGDEHINPRFQYDAAAVAAQAGSPTQYTCTMHPDVVQAEPGNCPICGMALVPREGGDDAPTTNP